jgi:lipoprotein-releasing system permease protein
MGRSGSTVSFVARRVLGRSRWGNALLIVVVALACGATMAAIAGGRRAATSYDRFYAWSDGAHALIGNVGGTDSAGADAILTQIAAFPGVESVARYGGYSSAQMLVDGDVLPFLSLYPVSADLSNPTIGRMKLLEGRFSDPTAVTEAIIPFSTAARFDLEVGDTVDMAFGSRTETIEIVGIVAAAADFPTPVAPAITILILTPAFQAAHEAEMSWNDGGMEIKLTDGRAGVQALQRAISDAGLPSSVEDNADRGVGVRRLLRIQAGVLWLIGGVLGAASALVLAQLMRRETAARAGAMTVLTALGLPRRQTLAAGALRGAVCGVVGAAAGIALAIAVSPAFPLGVARIAEPHEGVDVDVLVLVLGALVAVAVVAAIGGGVTWLATRPARARASKAERRRMTAQLPPAPSTGVRLAARSLRSTGAGSPLAGVLGLAVILSTLVGVVVLRGDVERVVDDQDLSGGTWDITTQFNEETLALAQPFFESQPQVAEIARGNWLPLRVNGRRVFTLFLEAAERITVLVDRGRAPAGPTEIALGGAVMRDLDVEIGDTVEVMVPSDFTEEQLSPPFAATVVGRPVLVSPLYEAIGQNGGAAVTLDLVRDGGYPYWEYFWFVRMHEEADDRQAVQDVATRSGADYWFQTADPSGIGALRDVRSLPLALIALLAVLAVVTIVQRLLVGSRANRRHLGILRCLGFTNRQLTVAGAVHGVLVVAVAIVVALAAGIVVARPVWDWVASYLSVVPVHVIPGGALGLTVGMSIAVALAAGVLVAERVRRSPPARHLRVE